MTKHRQTNTVFPVKTAFQGNSTLKLCCYRQGSTSKTMLCSKFGFDRSECFVRPIFHRRHPSVYMKQWSSTGVSSPVELRSLDRVYGRRAVVQAVSPPSPRDQWIQESDECRCCLDTYSIAGVPGVALTCQITFGTPAPDFLLGFTPLAFPRTFRPQGSSGMIVNPDKGGLWVLHLAQG